MTGVVCGLERTHWGWKWTVVPVQVFVQQGLWNLGAHCDRFVSQAAKAL